MALERLLIDLKAGVGADGDEMQHIARYKFAAPLIKGSAVLDIACGVGYGSSILAEAGASKVLGMDISEDAVAHARKHYGAPNVEFRVGSATKLHELGEIFKYVCSFETIEHLDAPRKLLEGIVTVMDPDGACFLSTPNRTHGTIEDKPGNQFHVIEWRADEFRGLLSGYFKEVKLYGQNFHLRAGRLPGSRTVRRALVPLLAPGVKLNPHEIRSCDSANDSILAFDPEFVVAVCRRPIP